MFTCPACEQTINQASEICPYCGADLAPAPVAGRRTAQRKGLLATLAGALVLAGGVWAMVWFILPRPVIQPRAAAEAGAIAEMRQVQAVLASYKLREGTYPSTIDQVAGQASRFFAGARRQGYFLVYQPGPQGAGGNVVRFVVLGRPEFYGYSNFYLDQTGVIRSTSDNRPATSGDPPIH